MSERRKPSSSGGSNDDVRPFQMTANLSLRQANGVISRGEKRFPRHYVT